MVTAAATSVVSHQERTITGYGAASAGKQCAASLIDVCCVALGTVVAMVLSRNPVVCRMGGCAWRNPGQGGAWCAHGARGMPTRSPQRNTACGTQQSLRQISGASGLFNGVRHRIADYDMFADVLAL